MLQRVPDSGIDIALRSASLSVATPLFPLAHPDMLQLIQLSSRISPIGTAQLHSAIEGFKHVLDADQLQDFESSNDRPDAVTVLKFTAHLDEINSERQSRCIATRLQTVLQSVQQFSTIVETFVSSNPKIAALVWGSLKFALLIASNFGSYFEKLSALFMKFGRHCPRYAEYQGLYLDSTRLQSCLCSFYATLVSCCTRAVETIKRPGWVHVAKIITLSSFESDFGAFEQELQHWSKEIKDEIAVASHKVAERERLAQSEERARAEDHRIWHWRRSKEQQLEMERLRSMQQRRSLLNKLSDHDYTRPWTRARRQCVVSTGQWIAHTKQFSDWVSDPASSLFCLTGKMGSGKTILTSVVHIPHDIISLLRNRASAIAELSRHVGSAGCIAYFFCRFDDEGSLHATTILSSLLKQILRPESLTPAQQSFLERMVNPGPPELTELESLLEDAISTTQFIVIDAFDECNEVERRLLLKSFQKVMKMPDRTVKLFLSSRDGDGWRTRHISQKARFISTNSPESSSDLRVLVKKRLDELVEEEHLIVGDRDILHDIEDHLLNKSQGMFLWVDFALQDLCSQRRDCDILAALQRLPIGLPEMYDRLLGRICNSGEKKLVSKIFHWIACARRPLSLQELGEAIAIEPLQKSSDPHRYVHDITQIPSWSRGLFTCDEEDNAMQFAHSTVKDFLLGECHNEENSGFHFEAEIVDHELGEICVTYLNFSDFERQLIKRPKPQTSVRGEDLFQANVNATSGQTGVLGTVSKASELAGDFLRRTSKSDTHFAWPEKRNNTTALHNIIGSHPFLEYASKYWIFHCKHFTRLTSTWSLWNRLLLSESSMLKTEWSLEEFLGRKDSIKHFVQEQQHCGLLEWIQTSEQGFSPKQLDGIFDYSIGAYHSNRLARKMFDLNETASVAWSCMIKAAEEKGIQLALNLLDEVNVPLTKDFMRTALPVAAEQGNLQVVERLLNAGADVNAPTARPGGRTAIQAAAEHGRVQVVERLLNAGANTNDIIKVGGVSVLHQAAKQGHLLLLERLLIVVAVVNAPELLKQTALRIAVEQGFAQAVEKLLSAGVDVNAVIIGYSGGTTALHVAAEHGHVLVVEKLLNAGADINVLDYFGKAALYLAAEKGHVQVVEKLLNAGVDVNVPSGYSEEKALHIAASNSHLQVVETLLNAGADINAENRRGRTALQLVDGRVQHQVACILRKRGGR